MLDRTLRLTFRDLSTYFLIVAAVVLPLEAAYAAFFSDVIAVRAVHEEIARLPEGGAILEVTADRLMLARVARWGLNLAELSLLPWLVGAARRVLERADRGEIATVVRALTGRGRGDQPGPRAGSWRARTPLLVTTAAISLGIGLLLRYLGELVIEPVQGPGSWAPVALVETVARAAGAPFFLVAVAAIGRTDEGELKEMPNLY